MTATIPLFPLNTVLFPEGRLPLRIFETRYVDMVRECMRNGTGFGVVLIQKGAEAGGPAQTYDVGTFARIVDFDPLDQGLLGITAVGERRFRVTGREVRRDGLNVGTVEWLAEAEPAAFTSEFEPYSQLVEGLLPELGDLYANTPARLDEPDWILARLLEILPLPLADKQLCLEMPDVARRLDVLRTLVRITASEPDDPESAPSA